MRRSVAILMVLMAVFLALAVPASASGGNRFPSVIPLPTGWGPEGIAVGRGTAFYVGSVATESIFKGDLATGQGSVFAQFSTSDGREAAGVYVDVRTNHVFVAGAFSGKAFVYDGDTGQTLATYVLPGGAFINDVVVTQSAAYFTDSFRPYIYKVPLGSGGQLLPSAQAVAVQLGGDFVQMPGFSANGIEETPGGKWLIIDSTTPGKLYRVDPTSGFAKEVALGGGGLAPGAPDGIRFVGNTLYVVENVRNRIAVVRLDPGNESGTVTGHIGEGDPRLEVPTTVAKFGDYLYAPNSRFDIAPPPAPHPGLSFDVVQLSR